MKRAGKKDRCILMIEDSTDLSTHGVKSKKKRQWILWKRILQFVQTVSYQVMKTRRILKISVLN
jgi:hypothetical protein